MPPRRRLILPSGLVTPPDPVTPVVAQTSFHFRRGDTVVLNDPFAGITPGGGTNSIYIEGTNLRRTVNNTIFNLRGFNMHAFNGTFTQASFNEIAAQGFTAIRLLFNWKDMNPTAGVYNTTLMNYAHTTIARARSAGIETFICLAVNSPSWTNRTTYLPDWSYNTAGAATPVAPWNTQSLFDVLASMGQPYIQTMVAEFQDAAGFEFCNEPDRWASVAPYGTWPAAIVQQGNNRMLNWARTADTSGDRLWPVATTCYSSQDPTVTPQNDWTAITDWTNVMFAMHTYFAPQSPTNDGYDTGHGFGDGRASVGAGMYWNDGTGLEATTYSTVNKASFRLQFGKWRQISVQYARPWVAWEFGVQAAKATLAVREQWAADMVEAAQLEGAAGMVWWDYEENANAFDAKPSGTWRTDALKHATYGSSGAGPAVTLRSGGLRSGGVEATQAKVLAIGNVQGASMRAVVSLASDLSSPIYGSSVTMNAGDSVNGFAATSIVAGLTANTTYWYGVEMNGTLNATRQKFKTLRTAGTGATVKVAMSSCQASGNWGNDIVYTTLKGIPSLHYFVHMGDLTYDDAGGQFTTIDQQRASWNAVMDGEGASGPGLDGYVAEFPWIYEYDSHDTGHNEPDVTTPQIQRAAQAYREWMPSYTLAAGSQSPIYQSWQDARTLHIMTDLRTGRTPNPTDLASTNLIMDATQEAWFIALLDNAQAQVAAGTLRFIYWYSQVVWNSGGATTGGSSWNSYSVQRTRLANAIAARGLTNRILIMSGNHHLTAYDNGTNSPGGIRELVTAPLNQTPHTIASTWTFKPAMTTDVTPYDSTRCHRCGVVEVVDPGGASEATVNISVLNLITNTTVSGSSFSFTTS